MPVHKGQSMPRTCTRGLRATAWWLIRKNRSVTLGELMSTLCSGIEKEPEGNLGRYLRALSHAGILRREREPDGKLTSNGVYRYHLQHDLGPKAPVVRASSGTVYDPNRQQDYRHGQN